MRILIIDDSRFTRALLRRDLGEDADVTEAGDGREGISVLTAGPEPDVIMCDLQMPHMNGFEFVKAARESGFAGPIVVCTANTQPSVEHRIRELGATEFVPKPDLLTPGRARDLVARLMEGTGSSQLPRRLTRPAGDPASEGIPGHDGMEILANLLSAFVSQAASDTTTGTRAALGRVRLEIPDTALGCPSFSLDLLANALPEGIAPDDPDPEVLMKRVSTWLRDAFLARFRETTDREVSISRLRSLPGQDDGDRGPTIVFTSELALEGATGPGQLTLTFYPDVLEEWCPSPSGAPVS